MFNKKHTLVEIASLLKETSAQVAYIDAVLAVPQFAKDLFDLYVHVAERGVWRTIGISTCLELGGSDTEIVL